MKVGIIGLGTISAIHVRAFDAHPSVQISAIAESDRMLLRKHAGLAPPGHQYRDYHDLLKDKDVDVVDILLPHSLHAPVIREALQAGKHVICEKPLVINPNDITSISALSKRMSKSVYPKQYFRFSSLHQKAKALMSRGDIGRPYLISATYTVNALDSFTNLGSWRGNTKEAGGGILMDVGIHMIDYLMELFGDPLSVWATAKKNFSSLPTKGEDLTVTTIEFRQNIVASMICTAADSSYGFRWEKHIFGSEGSIHLTDDGKTHMELVLRKNGEVVVTETEDNWWDHANLGAITDIVDRIIRGEPPAVSLLEVKEAIQVITGAYQSAKLGKKIYLRM
ncbi:MAG TPA: Gfo/Idh/MocA family oxidoreductase [Patescibacteria group bacterium]|jgi:predicted dehydrogenase|nr:Gfo/Idh/MocA family oxidoreductase [Patescibacteria group bacterium]